MISAAVIVRSGAPFIHLRTSEKNILLHRIQDSAQLTTAYYPDYEYTRNEKLKRSHRVSLEVGDSAPECV